MTRILAFAFALAILVLSTSCMDEDPAELSVRVTQGGRPLNAMVMIYNDKSVQVQEHHTDSGFVIIKQLKPGTYFIRLKDRSEPPVLYPAIRKVEISGGDSKIVDVDVDDASQNPADFAG